MATTIESAPPPVRSPGRRRGTPVARGERPLRLVVVTTIIVAILALVAWPIVAALLGSLHDWNPLNGTYEWVGTANYRRLFDDPVFWTSSVNTVVFMVGAILGRVVLGVALAYAIYSRLTRTKTLFRTLYYLPTVTPLVAVAYVWRLMYHPQFGAVNSILGLDVNWLYDSRFALLAVMVMTIWKDFGFAVILYLAGLYSLRTDVLQAAEVDGAGAWARFRRVIWPMLRPTTLLVVVTSMIGYLQAFVQVLVLTGGGPGDSTSLISYLIYQQAFEKYDFGYASAAAFVLFVATAVLTLLLFRAQSGPLRGKAR
ncbi:carbohydrate ABC transporter permease [Amorphoplanes digitatis]|uniref:Multiple sugar transport system permease protein n=1 Tax=Actinoplanes digitatis TaxID=1868 RepID=A0A7W7HW12_9ACTN|nr:sugar ABC transporter permease [Actinoplanes digitatis]MBB4761748.1 multiple sugar transport system permease protein [Actinoplanes digitatis]BFE70358.1 sugar ABC transporter permease [Actinoplanes digitatis]GID90859.1 ABC transporter permease [Actinoplanes digitatis]